MEGSSHGEPAAKKAKKEDEDFVAAPKDAVDVEDTLEEEEFAMGGAAGQKDEANALENEAEMPLEELLAQYGLSKDQLESTAALDAAADAGNEEEEEGGDDWEIDEDEAQRVAKGWYDTLGPFAGTYELEAEGCKAFRNSAREWSLRYKVSPDSGAEYFVRFVFERTHSRKGYKYNVASISEATASEEADAPEEEESEAK